MRTATGLLRLGKHQIVERIENISNDGFGDRPYAHAMRVVREQLIFLSLCVLEDWRERCRSGPAKPDFGLRVALAVLFALGKSGNREHYDRFWRNLTEPFLSAHSDAARKVFRMNEAHCCLEWITRDVGAPADPGYRSRLFEARNGSRSHAKVPQGQRSDPQDS
jgi:hypothetical protein